MPKQTNFSSLEEFERRSRLSEHLGLDARDHLIMGILQKDPDASQEEIAGAVRLSQPSVSARIKKLSDKGVLQTVNGINFSRAKLFLAMVDVHTTDTKSVAREFSDCAFFLNALVRSGRHNMCLFFMATDLRRLEGIVDRHLRKNPVVKDIVMNIVISTQRDFVLPTNLDPANPRQLECSQDCAVCD